MYIKKGSKTTHIIFTALLILILTFSFYQPMETYAANKTLVYEQSKMQIYWQVINILSN